MNIYRCVYAYVNQSRSWLPGAVGGITWFGPDRPATSVLMPFYARRHRPPSGPYKPLTFSKWTANSMWTAFNYVANYAMLKYRYMIRDIHAVRDQVRGPGLWRFRRRVRKTGPSLMWTKGDTAGARRVLTEYSAEQKRRGDSYGRVVEALRAPLCQV